MSTGDSGGEVNAQASNGDFEFAALQEARNYRAALLKSFRPFLGDEVIEVGAGIGQFTRELGNAPTVRRVLAVEPDTRFQAALASAVGEQNVVRGTAAGVPAGGNWSAIVSVNVLEHIEADGEELVRYRELLSPRAGHLCLFVPARPEIYAPLDRDFGHFRRYTRSQLRDRLAGAGFDIVSLRYFNFVGYFAWWFSFCVLKQRGFSTSAVRTFDRVLFPPVFWTEHHLFPPPIGQSLLAIARAPKS